ncbi:hypothetical protein AHF37_02047 [Paragonimus kellicotti]|nr:hypothetical protein AHF37_02047 [Paragonimus kellicotti]
MEAGLLCEAAACAHFPDYPGLERDYVAYLSEANKTPSMNIQKMSSYLTQEIQKAREHIKSSLDKCCLSRACDTSRIDELEQTVNSLIQRIGELEFKINKIRSLDDVTASQSAAVKPVVDGDVECDLFASDDEASEDPEAEKIRAQRLAEYEAKKTDKPAETAKSNIVLDVKPWGDDTDLKEMENLVRNIKADGLHWGQSKFVPLAYGIKKLQICCVVEDDKVGTDFLEETITGLKDHVQSVDIVAFNKV